MKKHQKPTVTTLIPSKKETGRLLMALKDGEEPSALRLLRGLAYEGLLAQRTPAMDARKMVLGPAMEELAKRVRFNVTFE
jgi:hypothetical protein